MKFLPAFSAIVFAATACAACAKDDDGVSLGPLETAGFAPSQDLAGGAITEPVRVAPESMADVRMSFAPIVDRASPAVVNVYTSKVVQRTTGDPFFDRFFGVRSEPQTSLGSGVIVSPDGVIVTNNHVIENFSEIRIVFADRREFDAEVLLTDPKTDLAVLKIEDTDPLPFLEFANSDAAEVGDIVLAIGNPFGVGQTVTTGIVSALARTAVSISDYQFFIQTDAAINPGNSGGALVDVDGRLLGVNTAIYSRSGGSNGIGFAIPARLVQQVIATAMRGGELQRPWTGASTETVSSTLAQALKLDRPAGVIINDLYKDGPLEKAGLRAGDVIVDLNGKPIFDAATLRYRAGIEEPGTRGEIGYIRNGERRTGTVVFDLPPEKPARDEREISGANPLTGVTVANLSPRYNDEIGINPLLEGVVIVDTPARSFARQNGLRRGYRIVSLNQKEITSAAQLVRELDRASAPWTFVIDTGNRLATWCTTARGRTCRS